MRRKFSKRKSKREARRLGKQDPVFFYSHTYGISVGVYFVILIRSWRRRISEILLRLRLLRMTESVEIKKTAKNIRGGVGLLAVVLFVSCFFFVRRFSRKPASELAKGKNDERNRQDEAD